MVQDRTTRRQALRVLSAGGVAVLAGCSGGDGGDGTPTPNGSEPDGGQGSGGETGAGSGATGPPTGEGWRTVGQDGGRTNATAGEGPVEDLAVTTLFDREAAELEPTAAPIAGDDALYCWTDAGVSTNLTRFSLEGEVEWSVQDGGQSLALGNDRLAYASAGTLVTRDSGPGDLRSEYEVAHFDNVAGPTIRDGVAFYGWNNQDDDQEPPYVAAADLATGEERWRTRVAESGFLDLFFGEPRVVDGTGVVTLDNGARVAGYDLETGEESWSFPIDGGGAVTDGASVVVGGRNESEDRYDVRSYAVPGGGLEWSQPYPVGGSDVVGTALDPTRHYLARPGALRAYDRSAGEVAWTVDLDDDLLAGPVVAANACYVATESALYALDPSTGDQLATAALDWGTSVSDPRGPDLSVAHGRVYVVDRYALRAVEAAA